MQQREFDTLRPPRQLICRPASHGDLAAAARFATEALPSVDLGDGKRFSPLLRFDPDLIQLFCSAERLVGLTAMLFLNRHGLQALWRGQLDFRDPSIAMLAPPPEPPAAIYAWLVACPGLAVAGLGAVSKLLSGPRYCRADLYARPETHQGLQLLSHIGFKPVGHEPQDLYLYVRMRNRYNTPKVAA